MKSYLYDVKAIGAHGCGCQTMMGMNGTISILWDYDMTSFNFVYDKIYKFFFVVSDSVYDLLTMDGCWQQLREVQTYDIGTNGM